MPASTELRKLAIVPAYNEEGMVGRVVRDIGRLAPGFDVLVVDDGSTDATAAEAEAEGAAVIRHPYNLGIGGAVQSGYKYALRGDYDVAVQVDGDGQHKPEYLPEMLAALKTSGDEADMVYGSRFRGDPGYRVPLGRRVGPGEEGVGRPAQQIDRAGRLGGQQGGQRSERDAGGGMGGLHPYDRVRRTVQPGERLDDQPALADTGRTGEEHSPACGVRELPVDQVEFRLTADEGPRLCHSSERRAAHRTSASSSRNGRESTGWRARSRGRTAGPHVRPPVGSVTPSAHRAPVGPGTVGSDTQRVRERGDAASGAGRSATDR